MESTIFSYFTSSLTIQSIDKFTLWTYFWSLLEYIIKRFSWFKKYYFFILLIHHRLLCWLWWLSLLIQFKTMLYFNWFFRGISKEHFNSNIKLSPSSLMNFKWKFEATPSLNHCLLLLKQYRFKRHYNLLFK